jgi:hypothetical protein
MGIDSGFLIEVSFPESFGFTETLSPRGHAEIMETPIGSQPCALCWNGERLPYDWPSSLVLCPCSSNQKPGTK